MQISIWGRNCPRFALVCLWAALFTDCDVNGAPQSCSRNQWHKHVRWSFGKLSDDLVKVEYRACYLSLQELDRSLCYRLVAREVSDGADNWRKAGPAGRSGPSGSGRPLHRSPCTAQEGKRKESATLGWRVSFLRSVMSNRRDLHASCRVQGACWQNGSWRETCMCAQVHGCCNTQELGDLTGMLPISPQRMCLQLSDS